MIALVTLLSSAGVTMAAILATRDGPSPATADGESNRPPTGASQDANAGIPSIPVDVPGWQHGQPITEETLRSVKAEEFFWTVYKRHAMTTVQELIQERWIADAGKPVRPNDLVTPHIRTVRVVIDYRSKAFARAETSRTTDGQLALAMICIDGQRYFKTETDLKHNRPYSVSRADARDCPSVLTEQAFGQNKNIGLWVNDSLLTGGLSDVQTDRFIDCLRERQLVSVSKTAIVQAAGKSYVAMEGEINRVEDRTISQDTKQGHERPRYAVSTHPPHRTHTPRHHRTRRDVEHGHLTSQPWQAGATGASCRPHATESLRCRSASTPTVALMSGCIDTRR